MNFLQFWNLTLNIYNSKCTHHRALFFNFTLCQRRIIIFISFFFIVRPSIKSKLLKSNTILLWKFRTHPTNEFKMYNISIKSFNTANIVLQTTCFYARTLNSNFLIQYHICTFHKIVKNILYLHPPSKFEI